MPIRTLSLAHQALQAEVAEKKSPVELGWLKVNAAKIKASLNTWTSRWINTYTEYLYTDCTQKLHKLDRLMKVRVRI